MNFGTSGSNPPWARQSGSLAATQLGNSQSSFGAQSNLFSGLSSNAQYNNAVQSQLQAGIGQPGIALPTSLGGGVGIGAISYPTARGAPNQVAQPQIATAIGQPKQRVFTGNVTKISENFGFVDEDVFFQISVCKGAPPKLGDRVLVEATYNANMPFKWNAARIQVLPNQSIQQLQQQQVYQQQVAAVQQMTALQQAQANASNLSGIINTGLMHQSVPLSRFNSVAPSVSHVPDLMTNLTHLSGTTTRGSRFDQRDRIDRSPKRERRSPLPNQRRRSRSPKKRSRSPKARSRSKSPRKKVKSAPRYSVQISPLSLDVKECCVVDIKSRYTNLYIPSDFYRINLCWADCFPLGRPFPLGQPTRFHIMPKEVGPLEEYPASVDPSDADHSFSAKVMLISCLPLKELYQQCCSLAEEPLQEEEFQHPARLLQFLVGLRGKQEPMAIGGPWSPSLDGSDPEKNPQTLINTAIRTTKALTGIDLSCCTQWFKFVDIAYMRAEETHKGRLVPAHTERVSIFLPDIWNAVPAMLDYEKLQASYRQALLIKLGQVPPPADREEPAEAANQQQDDGGDDDDAGQDAPTEDREASHWSKLETKSMKVVDLKAELEARGVSSKGLKSQLAARLNKLIKVEQEKEEKGAAHEVEKEKKAEADESQTMGETVSESQPVDKEVAKELEKRKEKLEKLYKLHEKPSIVVHPNYAAKGGKFDCALMSLSVLLDYRQEDNKEHSFEVSLFAESFNEMLMRDFGFTIFKRLVTLPDTPKDKSFRKPDKSDDSREDKKSDSKDNDDDAASVTSEKSRISEEPDKKKRRADDDDKDRKRKEGKEEKKKQVTADKEALLAFVYFDTTHTGYIMEKDVEQILHTLGLQLSRAQVRKLIQKSVVKEMLHYRKLTDRSEDDDSKVEDKSLGSAESVDQALDTIARGNRELASAASSNPAHHSDSGVIIYKGAVLDLDKVTEKVEKSEASLREVEQQMRRLSDELADCKRKAELTADKNKKLAIDLKNTAEKLNTTLCERSQREEEAVLYQKMLTSSRGELHKLLGQIDSTIAQGKASALTDVKTEPVDVNQNRKPALINGAAGEQNLTLEVKKEAQDIPP